jgi:hypothetical protein
MLASAQTAGILLGPVIGVLLASQGGRGSNSQYVFFRLMPHSHTLQPLPVTGDKVTGEMYNFSLRYVPMAYGISGRLVGRSALSYHSWAGVSSDLAGKASDLHILWTPVP